MNFNYSATGRGEYTSLGVKIPNVVYQAIQDGNAILNCTVGKNGVTTWVQFMDPDMAHETFDLMSAEAEIKKKSLKKSDSHADSNEGVIMPVRQKPSSFLGSKALRMSLETAQARVDSKNLGKHRKQGG
jgi:hypothetical protein